MKTISTLFTSLLFSAAVLATDARHSSMITVKAGSRSEIQVVIDGKNFTSGKNIVMVDNVNPGYHSVTVYRKSNFGFGQRDFEQVYTGSIAVKPATDVQITISRHGKTDIAYQSNDRSNDDFGYNRPVNSYPADNDNGRWEDNKSYSGYAQPISDREFNQVMSSMQKEWFEKNKMKSASYIITGNFFTTDQVKEMMSLFNFEDNKLEIAKQAYSKTLDKENYHCVTDALTFNNSKQELALFIRGCEN